MGCVSIEVGCKNRRYCTITKATSNLAPSQMGLFFCSIIVCINSQWMQLGKPPQRLTMSVTGQSRPILPVADWRLFYSTAAETQAGVQHLLVHRPLRQAHASPVPSRSRGSSASISSMIGRMVPSGSGRARTSWYSAMPMCLSMPDRACPPLAGSGCGTAKSNHRLVVRGFPRP